MAYDIAMMANNVFRSHLFPVNSIEQCATLMLIAESEGVHPMKALQMYDLIPGKPPRMKATEMQARFQRSGGKLQWKKRTDAECTLWGSHPSGGELEVTWTMERAKNAGLAGRDNWRKFPAQMLASKCVAELVRALFPECINGMYTAEECGERPATCYVEDTPCVIVNDEEELRQACDNIDAHEALIKEIGDLAKEIDDADKRARAFAWLDNYHGIADCEKMKKRMLEIINEEKNNG